MSSYIHYLKEHCPDCSEITIGHNQLVAQHAHSIYDALPSMVAVVDADLKYQYGNQAFLRQVGMTLNEIIGLTVKEVCWKAFAEMEADIRRVLSGEEVHFKKLLTLRNKTFMADGRLLPQICPDGNLVGYYSIVTDITNLTTTEDKLKVSENKFQAIFEESSIGIAMLNAEGKITTVNQAAANFTGYSKAELETLTFDKLVHPEDLRKSIEDFARLVNGEMDYFALEKRYLRKEGDFLWGNISMIASRDECGNLQYALAILENIHERKLAHQALKETKENLSELVQEQTQELQMINKDLEAFAYSISHDLRAPLRAISSFSALLKRALKNPTGSTAEYLDFIQTGVKNMSQMIDALLEFSRLGRSPLTKKTFDAQVLVNEIVEEFKVSFPERNIRWVVDQNLPNIDGDRTLLGMVFENLLSNAVKFTKDSSPAIIEIGTLEVAELSEVPDDIALGRGQEKKILFVRDNGVGFDEKQSEKLFKVFQRLHNYEEFEGVGIGLANCKRIIQKHNGAIWAEAEVGLGATFYMAL